MRIRNLTEVIDDFSFLRRVPGFLGKTEEAKDLLILLVPSLRAGSRYWGLYFPSLTEYHFPTKGGHGTEIIRCQGTCKLLLPKNLPRGLKNDPHPEVSNIGSLREFVLFNFGHEFHHHLDYLQAKEKGESLEIDDLFPPEREEEADQYAIKLLALFPLTKKEPRK